MLSPCWHASTHHEAWLELLTRWWHPRSAHHVRRASTHHRPHVRRPSEHPLTHELLLVTASVHLRSTHVRSTIVMVKLLLLLWIIHVPIFSCFVYLAVRRDVAITHLHLDLLL